MTTVAKNPVRTCDSCLGEEGPVVGTLEAYIGQLLCRPCAMERRAWDAREEEFARAVAPIFRARYGGNVEAFLRDLSEFASLRPDLIGKLLEGKPWEEAVKGVLS